MPESISQSVGGKLVAKSASFTRPANATPYTAGDVVSNSISATVLMQFGAGLVRLQGGSGLIVKARLETDLKTDVAQYRLILYTKSESTVTVPVDNAADTSVYANKAYRVGFIDFPACAESADGTNSTAAVSLWTGGTAAQVGPLAFICDGTMPTGETSLYGKLVNMTGTTPGSAQNFWVELTVLQN